MKKFILLFVATVGISTSFVSCSKDDDASIVGKWEFYKAGINAGGNEILLDYENDCSTKKDYIEFLSNGFTNSYEYDSDCDVYVSSSSYVKSGKTITVTNEEGSFTATIVSLSSSTLKTKIQNSESPDTYDIAVLKRVTE